MKFIPPYIEDVIEDKAGVMPAVLFGAGSSGAIALLFERSRPYAFLSAAFGGMVGAAFAMAQDKRVRLARLSRSAHRHRTLHAPEAATRLSPPSPLHAAAHVGPYFVQNRNV